jgi:hypothetical protein
MKVNLHYSWVLKLEGDAFSLLAEVVCVMVNGHVWMGEDSVSVIPRKCLEHAAELVTNCQNSRIAALFWSHVDYLRLKVHVVPF